MLLTGQILAVVDGLMKYPPMAYSYCKEPLKDKRNYSLQQVNKY